MWALSSGLKNLLLGSTGLKDALANGQIRIFSGSKPANADMGEQGTHLCTITLGSAAMVSGTATNGLVLDTPAGGRVNKPEAAVWSGKNLANGTAGWFRWYPNAFDTHTGAATGDNKIRLDGNCGISSGELELSSLNLKVNVTTTIDNVDLLIP